MSTPTRSEIVSKAADGTLLEAIFFEYKSYGHLGDDACIAVLADAHNDGEVDLLGLLTSEALTAYSGPPFFRGQSVYCALIGKLDASTELMMRAVDNLLNAAGNDGAAGLPVDEFAKWCAADAKRPVELLDLIEKRVPGAERYLAVGLITGAAFNHDLFVEHAYYYLANGSDTEVASSVRALSQISVATPTDCDRLITELREKIGSKPADQLCATILNAVIRQLKSAPSACVDGLSEIAISALESPGDQTLFEAARALWQDYEVLPTQFVEAATAVFTSAVSLQPGTINFLDYAMSAYVKNGRDTQARDLIGKLLLNGSACLAQFVSSKHELIEKGGFLLADWSVAWLRTGDACLCEEMNKSLVDGRAEDFPFSIDFGRYDLDEPEYLYIARKSIGYFFLKPVMLASTIVSLLRSAPASAASELEELLFDPILINHSGVVSEYLKEITDNDADKAAGAAKRTLEELSSYIEGLKAIGDVPELYPSERERQIQSQRRSDLMSESFRRAREKSVFASIFQESVLLHESSSVDWVYDQSKKGRRIETPLNAVSHSFELPRIDTIDPFGLQFMFATYRNERSST